MDPVSITAVTTFLAPYAPYLAAGAKGLATEVGKKVGAAGWELAKTMWARVGAVVLQRTEAKEALDTLKTNPADAEASDDLQRALKKVLSKDVELARALVQLLDAERDVVQRVQGERSTFKDVEQSGLAGTRSVQEIQGRDSSFEGVRQKVTKE